MRKQCTRTCNLFFTSPIKFHANAIKPPHYRNFSLPSAQIFESDNPGIITTHNRQKHRQYLGKLLLSPPQKTGNHGFYYKTVHAQIILSGFGSNVFLSNILLTAYSRCGSLRTAVKLFDKMPERNLITWSSMISAYNQNGYDAEALMLFREFRESGDENPNEFVLATVIQSCTHLASVENGKHIHGFVIKSGYSQNAHVGTSLINFYAKTSDLDAARLVFDELDVKNVVTWTAIISGFSINGMSDAALDLFKGMVETGVCPDSYAVSSVLSACSILELLEMGKQVHAYVLRNRPNMDVLVNNMLIDFYAKCGKLKVSERIFEMMEVKNVISWATMISGYMQSGFNYEAMNLFKDMNILDLKADGFGCTSVITSCGSVKALAQGKQVHAYTVKANLDLDEFVINSLIDMYCKCDSLIDARRVFVKGGEHSVICYNAMIEGYSSHGNLNEAFDIFIEMRGNLVSPGILTFVSLIGVSASRIEIIRQLHALVIKFGFRFDSFIVSAFIDVYSKFSYIRDARLVFDEIKDKDIVVWNSMLSGYALQSENEAALKLFIDLQRSRERPNTFTFVAIIVASGNLASLLHGLQFHTQVTKTGLHFDPFVTNALMDMYAKCGNIDEAQLVFNDVLDKDTACWNSIISLQAHHGNAQKALLMFNQMKAEGTKVKPDYVTFVGVLSACAHVGLVEEGFHHFDSMFEFGLEPGEEHYACMVSLLGRAGKLHEAKIFIENMPFRPGGVVWKSLLSACRVSGDIKMGQYAAEMAIRCDPTDSGAYVLLSNIFADKSMWMDVKKVREKMNRYDLVRIQGISRLR